MKQTLLTLTTLLITAFTFAYDIQIDDIYYDLNNENQTATVTHDGDLFPPSNAGYNQSKITIPSKITYNNKEYSVTSIGDYAFSRCSSLTSITIPNSVTSIGEDAFYNCSSLSSVHISDIAAWCNIDFKDYASNPLYYAKNLYLNGEEVTNLVIPEGVTSIRNYAFYYCSSLKSISIPNSVTSIGSSAFEGCSSLTSITIPNSVTSIGDYAFWDCLSLTSISIPNSVTSIGSSAFEGCSSLTSITIGNSVTYIGNSAFSRCSSLTSITIPNSVTSIGSQAFSGCTRLTSITIPNSVTSIESWAFNDCSSLISITIPNSVTSIGSYAFSSCSSLTSITCLGSTPPNVDHLGTYNCTLYVPKGSLNDYQNHTEWGKFQNIQEHQLNKLIISTSVNDDTMGYVPLGGEYAYGTNIILTATAYKGYRFIQWSDGNSDNPRSIIVTKDSTFTAEFALEEFALYATSASPELGYVKHTIEAVAIEGFEFDHWSDGDTKNPRTIILTEDIKLYAYFRMASGGTTTDIETSKIQSAKIYTHNGILHIEDVETDYHVLDASGRLIYTGRDAQIQLPRGVYVIAVDGEVQKIVL